MESLQRGGGFGREGSALGCQDALLVVDCAEEGDAAVVLVCFVALLAVEGGIGGGGV